MVCACKGRVCFRHLKRQVLLLKAMADRKSIKRKLVEVGGWRLVRAIPYVGAVAAVGLVGYDIRKKGLVNGLLNSGLDALPLVGLGKNVIEHYRGDFFPDKQPELKIPSRKGEEE